MASTLRPIDAIEYAKRFVKDMPLEDVQWRILDDVSKYLWMAAPWRWTLGLVGQILMLNGQQDYTLAVPADFLYPIYAYYGDGTSPNMYLEIEPKLASTVIQQGNPTRLSYEGSNTWRLYPNPVISGTKVINIFYKKIAPVLTPKNIYDQNVLILDDEWFWVYEEGVLWKAYLYADDPRAGSAQMDSRGQWQYSGKRADFESAIQKMREREKLPIFGFQTAPDPKVGVK